MRKCFLFVLIATVFLIVNLYLNYATNNHIISRKLFGYSIKELQFENFQKLVNLNVNGVHSFQFEFIRNKDKKPVPINPHDFNYVINPEYQICGYGKKWSTHSPTLLALVISAPDHFEQRLAIRRTWSNKSLFPHFRTVFLLGSAANETLNKAIQKESSAFGDIVQEDFMDTYANLTLKTVSSFKWSAKYCPQADFMLKVDDDILVNSYYLNHYLKSVNSASKSFSEDLKNTFLCLHHVNVTVIRDVKHKYYISPNDFKENQFKPYCSGGAYMFTSDLAHSLYTQSLYTRTFFLEDVYVGMLAYELKSSFKNLNKNYCWHRDFCEQAFKKKINSTYFFYLENLEQFYDGWNTINKFVKEMF